jgi:predicted nuclease of predicted toxin-antitoxin system
MAVAERTPRLDDTDVMEQAVRGKRILITEDKDFGHLVYAKMQKTGGVMLIRFPAGRRGSLVDTILEVVAARGARLVGSFSVLQPGRVRTGPRPPR